MSQALYRKWRPASWEEVVGQDHIIQTLHNAIVMERVGHAYLFAGPRGTGKTTSARLLAKAVNCLHPDLSARPCNECAICTTINQGRFMDLIEIDAASNTSVDDVRELKERVNFAPSQGRFKVYIIDEVHMLSTSAFNALLKTLEEPPPHVIFILATTEIHKIPATVLSRCQRHEFRRIPIQTITSKLRTLCDDEGIQVSDETLNLVARQSTGSLRDAISLVDQLASMSSHITLETAQDILGTATSQAVIDLVEAILTKDQGGGLTKIHQALDAGSDPRQFARQVVEYLRNLLMIQMGLAGHVEAPADIKDTMVRHAGQFGEALLLKAINRFSEASTDLRASWHPGLGLELAFASMITEESEPAAVAEKSESMTEISQHPAEKETKAHSKKSSPEVNASETRESASEQATAPEKSPEESIEKPSSQEVPGKTQAIPQDSNQKLLNENWKLAKELIRKASPLTEALVNSARLMSIQNDSVLLSFPSELLKERMSKGNNLAIVQKALKKIFNKDMKVKCMIGGKETNQLMDTLDIDSDSLVGFATHDLGGQIVEID